MTRVIVTGATGFVGAYATDALVAAGYEVHALGRTAPARSDVAFHAVDLRRADDVADALDRLRASHLLHLAWDVTPGTYWRSADNLTWTAASLNLLRAFAEAGGRRAVLAGTCAEYAWGAARFVEAETPCVPETLYGSAKDALRRVALAFGATAPLSVAWGRIFFLYGPAERPGRLVSDAVAALLEGRPFATSHGRQRRDFLHVADVAGAFAALVGAAAEGAVNIGSGAAVSVRDLLGAIARETGRAECLQFGARALPDTEPDAIEADVRRLSEEVGFRPAHDLASGIADTVRWYRRRTDG